MEHTPFGYVIVDGKPQIHEMEAARLSALFSAYLLGMSCESAAEVAGIKANHSMVKKILHNKRYLGDDIYPRIIDDDTFNAVEAERLSREKKLGRDKIPSKEKPVPVIFTDFYTKKSTQKYTDPIAQAEYAYGRIEGKVKE